MSISAKKEEVFRSALKILKQEKKELEETAMEIDGQIDEKEAEILQLEEMLK